MRNVTHVCTDSEEIEIEFICLLYCVCFANTLIANFVGVVQLSHMLSLPLFSIRPFTVPTYKCLAFTYGFLKLQIKCLMSATANKYKRPG